MPKYNIEITAPDCYSADELLDECTFDDYNIISSEYPGDGNVVYLIEVELDLGESIEYAIEDIEEYATWRRLNKDGTPYVSRQPVACERQKGKEEDSPFNQAIRAAQEAYLDQAKSLAFMVEEEKEAREEIKDIESHLDAVVEQRNELEQRLVDVDAFIGRVFFLFFAAICTLLIGLTYACFQNHITQQQAIDMGLAERASGVFEFKSVAEITRQHNKN